MPAKLLDPTLDITFKLLLLRNPVLLRDMIESVVKLPGPIANIEILNPEIPLEFPADKSIALDIRVRLENGHQIDLEMQSTFPPAPGVASSITGPGGSPISLRPVRTTPS